MKEINILIVEDESIVAMEIESYIEKLGYRVVSICSNAGDAFKRIKENPVDIVMMDIHLKGAMDGVDAAARIKEAYPHIETIFLTAHLDDYNVDRAIKIDPVAYLSKPFNREELRVFLKIALRKIRQDIQVSSAQQHIVLDHEFSYDQPNHTLLCCQEIIDLTKKEHALLELFIQSRNYIIDLYTIENAIWPEKETSANTIRTLVKRLRQKLKHKFIETLSTRGYRFTTN